MYHSINLEVLLSECLTTTFSCFVVVFLLLFFFYVKNILFCYFDKLHLKCMIILCTVQRGSAYKLLTSTSTFFRSICEIGFTC